MPFFFPQLGPLAINRYPVPQTFATPSESPGDDERITRVTSKKKHSNRFLMVKTLESTCLMLKHFLMLTLSWSAHHYFILCLMFNSLKVVLLILVAHTHTHAYTDAYINIPYHIFTYIECVRLPY